MMARLSERGMAVAESLHRRLFGTGMGEETRGFVGRLSWSLLGGILASAIMFFLTIAAGRLLGPETYGRYNELLSFATALSTVFFLGMDVSSVRYLSDEAYAQHRSRILSTTLGAIWAWSLLAVLGLLAAKVLLPGRLSLEWSFLIWAVGFGFVLTLKKINDGFLRAFHLIKQQSLLRLVEAALVLAVFLVLVLGLGRYSDRSYAAAMIAGELFFAVVALLLLGRIWHGFDWPLLKKMFGQYNRFLILASVLGMVVASDRFLIGRLVGLRELGIYGAYYSASHLVVAELGALFMNVFWPTVIKNLKHLSGIVAKTNRVFLGGAPLWVLLILGSTALFVWLFGRDYPLRLDYLLLFSLNSFMGFLFSLYLSFLNIHYVRHTVWLNLVFTAGSIGALLLGRSFVVYLLAQILIQAGLIWLMIRVAVRRQEGDA